ncbi:MAG: cofactor-independent phosphoglycerate mutase [Firmicutes bacterium ADurb.Bin193]|nr:MAG: cofactor-independent phosphoglycerate mutase [Firmicutes bacterium ADurb.Bin193]
MKYIVVLGDGMSDYPVEALNGKTPLEVARKPYMDMISQKGELGLAKTVPDDLPPGSDVANLSVMGYDPHKYYTGRSPLEAVSMGVELSPYDTAFRVNTVTLSDDADYLQKTMLDYSAGEISTKESGIIISDIQKALGSEFLSFYAGVSYRHLLVWKGCEGEWSCTPPHDISGKKIASYLPDNPVILGLMQKSAEILKDHPVNKKRIENGQNPANSIWIWGQGKKPVLPSFSEKYGVTGCVISAVDLVKGLGICAGIRSVAVAGTTGNIHTDFGAKARAALDALKTDDFVYIHIEAPDECGHHFEIENKVRAIELIDEKVIKPVFDTLTAQGVDFSILVMPDHATPLSLGTHVADPVPYALYRSGNNNNNAAYTEANAAKYKLNKSGHTVMDYFIRGE